MRVLLQSLIAAASLWLVVPPAQAGIPIPCTGETVVKVLDIDSVPGRKPGIAGLTERRIDLGYKFNGCSGGGWVGYTGEYRNYLALPEPLLKLLLLKVGRTEFPPAPSFMGTFSASWVVWMYIVLSIPILLAGIFGKNQRAPAGAIAETEAVAPPASSPGVSGPPARAQPPLGPNAAAASAGLARKPNIHSRLGNQQGFGRRA